jgi:glycosyltransferase involved in cell wall biosynthesis
MKQIHQFLTSYSYGDAIGNETFEIREFLRNRGFDSHIFALHYHPRYAGEIINYLEYDCYSHPDNVAIFHFSIGSPVTRKFLRIPEKKVIIYHNITPYHFFLDYHRILAKDCYKGRLELQNMVDRVDLALGDSHYNEQEMKQLGFKQTGVLPLVMDFSKFDRPVIPVFDRLFNDGRTNILYVGRVIPNKKLEDIIKVFHLYQTHFNPRSRLFVIGEYRGFERYLYALQNLIQRLKVQNVHFSGHIPEEELVSYYKLSRVYLHLSEHEGFCAPVPESFYINLPCVAFDGGAVAETMGRGGILVKRKEPLEIAALIDQLVPDGDFREKVLASQQREVSRFQRARTGQILLDHIQKMP